MCAVVGPNGCGKSNIIDAVRWVMGESSAKHLRGESMTDVIFNGSVGRAPVSQASIELVFDNSAQMLQGEFSRYSEISIRRKVTRDAQSFYYLNGNKCRRKDITDIFLGTGLGPRSYAIIEQGMISRLIESKPEELRVFIEEAAGISRYKERRKETESRIKRTRENLERLRDVREELERQLQNLQRQAKTAEKYREFKAEERVGKARLAAVRWDHLQKTRLKDEALLRDQVLELEKSLTDRVKNDSELERLRELRREQAEAVDVSQAAFYQVGAEIAGLEQQLKGTQERALQYEAERKQLQQQIVGLNEEVEREKATLDALSDALAGAGPELEELRMVEEMSAERFEAAEQRMQTWQLEWDQFAGQSAQAQKSAEIEQTRIQQVERNLQLATSQLEKFDVERQQLGDDDAPELNLQREQLAETEMQMESDLEALEGQKAAARQSAAELERLLQRLNTQQGQLQVLKGEQSSLQALEASVDNDASGELRAWLKTHHQDESLRMVSRLQVDARWEKAVESVLGARLQSGLVALPMATLLAAPLPEGISLISVEQLGDVDNVFLKSPLLAAADWTMGVRPAGDRAEAIARLNELGEGESFLLPCGTRVGRTWVVTPPLNRPELGSLSRQKRLQEIALEMQALDAAIDETQQARQRHKELEGQYAVREREIQQRLTEIQRRIVAEKSRISAEEARQGHYRQRREAIAREVAEITARRDEDRDRLKIHRESWQDAMEMLESQALRREQMQAQREQLRLELDQLRAQARQDRERLHQLQMERNALSARKEGLQQSLDKSLTAVKRAQERLEWIADSLESLREPEEGIRLSLESALDRRVDKEKRLADVRRHLQETEDILRRSDQERLSVEGQIQTVRQSVERLRMAIREAELRQQAQLEQIHEMHAELQPTLDALPEGMTEARLEADLTSLASRIERLGAINLAAIDEYEMQSQRKIYLDEQNADLEEALETLENAIRKIDRETRQKFKETFDQVNGSLQALFPKVFGGGSASLELTGDDLLETGVTIMARPPGKKNSTIHLLSGGEKALTAIALVFSIFRLNPAPFCMLDEVDAPLDDANVGRYARMVKEMSDQVQFIYISHNKIAMEMADHLLGVTMHEPGVSRMVSVDVEEAAALAGL